MSGIFGIVNLEGKVDREDLEKMSARLSHRGQDAHEIWMSEDGRVGFGHRMRWTVPENMHEPLPYEDEEGYVITADARLDNREELQVLLGWQHLDLEKLGDSRLILGAYKKWGDQSPEKLKGDFAYVLWDPSNEKLVAGKDYFGVKPLFFYQKENLFCFASEIKGLLELDYIPRTLNQTEVENYLNNLHYRGVPLETTFYEDIYRILPAHSYHFSKQEKTKDYYGQRLWDSIEINVDQDDLPGEFRRVFQESIDQRIRCIGRVGSQLSGGLDSSSVSLLAAESLKKEGKTLYTAYANSNVASSDESNYVQDVLDASDNMEHSSVDMLHPLESLEQLSGIFDEPLRMPCSSVNHAALEGLSSKNAKVVLTGHDGDTIVGFGGQYISILLNNKLWKEYNEAFESLNRNYQAIPDKNYPLERLHWEHLASSFYIKNKIISPIKTGNIAVLIPNIRNTNKLRIPARYWIESLYQILINRLNRKRPFKEAVPSPIGYQNDESTFKENYTLWNHANLKATEELDLISQKYGIDLRHPFLDTELAFFQKSVPHSINFHNGFGRGMLRLSKKNILPESITNRSNKVDFNGFIFKKLGKKSTKSNNPLKILRRISTIKNYRSYHKDLRSQYFRHWKSNLTLYKINHEKEIRYSNTN